MSCGLLLLAALLVGCCDAAGNIGCLFSNTLCENEWCFDDYAFGRCFPVKANLKEDDLTRYHLGEDELHVLEAEMQRLYHLGYRWSHTYTQCVLQALLKAIHESMEFDVTSCNDELDQDLEGALRAIEGEEQEAVSPRDLAIVRFTPSATDPHSDYADEFYFPAIEGGKLLPAPFRELPPLPGDKLPQPDLNSTTPAKTGQGKAQKVSNEVLFNDTPDSSRKTKENPHDLKTALKTAQGGSNGKVAKPFYSGKADRPGMKPSAGSKASSALKSGDTNKVSLDSQPYSSNYFDVNPIDRQMLSGVSFQKSNPYDYSGVQRDEYLRNKIYPKNPYSVNVAQYAPQNKEYLVDPGYSMDGFLSGGLYPGNGFMGDQPVLDGAPEEPEIDFMPRGLESKFPASKPRKMSNKEYLKQHLNFPVRDYEEYEDTSYDPAYDKGLYGGRSKSLNPLYRKRSSKSQRFNLRNFLNEFNDYVKSEREKTKHSKKDMRSRPPANASNVATDDAVFPGRIDPELRKDFMSFAEDVMRKDRYGEVKPQYNTAELKKLAAIIDELRTMQQGPHDHNPLPRPLDRSELQPVYAKPLTQRSDTNAAAESSQNEIADYYPDASNGAYLRVDKAIPYGSPSRYPVHPRPHIDRYAYAPYTDDFKQADDTYLGSQDTAGGEQGYYHQGQVPPTDLYYKGQQPETFYPAYGPAYDYHRNSIDSQFPDTPVPLDEDPYDTYKDGFGSQTKYPFFYLPEGPMYDYPMYDYGTPLDGAAPSASDDPDSANFVKKDEETADSEYGTIMGAEGKPLPYNFERPERVDVKKPGPNFYTNRNAFHDAAPVYYYDLGPYVGGRKVYDNYPRYGYLYNDPYYDMEDVDTVGGGDSGEGTSEGNYPNDAGDLKGEQRVRYRDANGNAIDIGLATGRGGMIPMVQDSESAGARFSQLLRKQGLKGSTLHPGTNIDRLMRLHHPARLPDLLLTEEMVVDNVSRGLANQHHAKMMNRPHGMHPGRMNMDMGQGRLNQSSSDEEGVTHAASLPPPSPTYVYVDVNMSFSSLGEASDLASLILHNAGLSRADIQDLRVEDNRMLFTLRDNLKGVSEQDIADRAQELAPSIQRDWNVLITRAGVASSQGEGWSVVEGSGSERRLMVGAAVVSGVMAAAVVAAAGVLLLRRHAAHRNKLRGFTNRDTEASKDYQDLCRARMAAKNKSVHSSGSGAGDKDGSAGGNLPGTHAASKPRIASLSKESDNGGNSPGSRSSTSSWSEEPVAPNMDISTGHMVLSYMEDHLQNKSRLDQEWVALCAYEAEPSATMVAKKPTNQKKNRYPAVLPYDHNRVHLNQQANISGSDYINASSITDHDPRNPAYIATQGPLATTTADFWQLVWEQGSVVIVMLTKLNENGHTLCHHYWPQEGSQLYHIYEVHLVSEHIWCDDYLVRSFYLKNTRTGETRTVTQFHFLSWPDTAIPVSTKALLEFRRKVNKSYRGRSCPIIVHCSDGIGRSGTYILIDMVLNRMAKGAKEIDIAATLEHIRDQRANMVATKLQFEFVLMAVAEEVHAILKALPQ